MIKYKLSEIAKNLNISSKEVSEVLKNYLNVNKKSAAVLTEEELNEIGIFQSTIRLSIGTENINDIIEDLEGAFSAI